MARQRLPSLNSRIRTKRSQLGLTGAELAQRADISPSYVSLIEKGAKVPDEEVAARLARALRDDEDLYRGWARASRLGLHKIDILSRLEAISRSPAQLKAVERGEALPAGAPAAAERSAPSFGPAGLPVRPPPDIPGPGVPRRVPPSEADERRWLAYAAAEPAAESAAPGSPAVEPGIVRVPVLAEGADPGKLAPSPVAVEGHFLVDRGLVEDHAPDRLFAYDVSERDMRHLRGIVSPGDRIVFRRGGRVVPDRVCAVRTADGIVLSRVLFKGNALLLLPGEGERDFESVDVEGVKALPGVVAGTHVLVIRR